MCLITSARHFLSMVYLPIITHSLRILVKVTDEFQYGDWCGKPFLVLHDKRRYKPPQQSFLCAEVSDLILPDENDPGVHGFGFGFGVGTFGFMDPLKDFEAPKHGAV